MKNEEFENSPKCLNYKRINYDIECSEGKYDIEKRKCKLDCSKITIQENKTREKDGHCVVDCKEGYIKEGDICLWQSKNSYNVDCDQDCMNGYEFIKILTRCICNVAVKDYKYSKQLFYSACKNDDEIIIINNNHRCAEKCSLRENFILTQEEIQCTYCPNPSS